MARVLVSNSTITGEVKMFAGSSAPEGYFLCQGQAVSRTTYANLFAILGTTYGSGDGSTTFNLPDYRGSFLRGEVNINTITGSGTASSNNATFTSHGINRTGFKVRLSSGTLTGLSTATDYYAIVVDSNTLAFATSLANAIAGTKIAISGANSAIITQYEDPDKSSRVNKMQEDASQKLTGQISVAGDMFTKMNNPAVDGVFYEVLAGSNRASPGTAGSFTNYAGFDSSRVARTSTETRPKNTTINYIIKY